LQDVYNGNARRATPDPGEIIATQQLSEHQVIDANRPRGGLRLCHARYDGVKRLLTSNNPEMLAPMYYVYDDANNLKQKTDANAVVTTYGYDVLNRNITKAYSDSTPPVTFTYDVDERVSGDTNPNFSIGRLSQVSFTGGTPQTTFNRYNAMGWASVSTQTTSAAGVSGTFPFSYSYNLAGGLESETYPSGRVVSYCHDSLARTSQVTGTATLTPFYSSQLSYAPDGQLTSQLLG
jgi:YD repeat-containing protein